MFDLDVAPLQAKAAGVNTADGVKTIKVPAGCAALGTVQGVPILKYTVAYSLVLILFAYIAIRCCCCRKKHSGRKRGVFSAAEDEGVEMTNRVVVGGVVQEFTIGDKEEDDPFGLDNEDEVRQ
jgi:hypothetical protein